MHRGVKADPSKIEKVQQWAVPQTAKQLQGFLGLVQYLQKFIKGLANHTAKLTPLTKKGLTKINNLWGEEESKHFEAIKAIVTLLPCL